MADIFLKDEAAALLKEKRILFIGDSNIRALYKDFLQLVKSNTLSSVKVLKAKLLESVGGDKLVKATELKKGRDFKEERVLDNHEHYFHYFFVTRCYSDTVEGIMKRLTKEIRPDVIIMNSCLWDITRWGPNGVDTHKENLHTLIQKLKELLSPTALVIWTTTLPVAQEMKGGFLIPQVEFMKYQLRYEVMEANYYTWQLFTENGYDIIDFHYHLQMQLTRRAEDGVHWMPEAVRHMTNLVLTHIALAWRVPLPGRFHGIALDRKINGPLLPSIDAPPLPPVTKPDTTCTNSSSSARRNRKRTPSAERRKSIHTQPGRSRSGRRMENHALLPDPDYNSNGYPRRRIVRAKRFYLPHPPVVNNRYYFGDCGGERDVEIRAPWYK